MDLEHSQNSMQMTKAVADKAADQPLVPVMVKKKLKQEIALGDQAERPSWPLIHPNLSLLSAALASKKSDQLWPYNFMMATAGRAAIKSATATSAYPNPILAFIANRSHQLFGLLRPMTNNSQPQPQQPNAGLLDLPTILMLQSNILAMLNHNNRQVKSFSQTLSTP